MNSDFKVTGSWGEALRQIGNAVPVKLGETVGRHLYELLRNDPVMSVVNDGNVIYSYPESVDGEQMLLAMERKTPYHISRTKQKRQ